MYSYRPNNSDSRFRRAFSAATLARLSAKVINIAVIAVTVALFVTYLGLNNRTSTMGFRMREVERKISALETQRQKLDLAVVSANSMDTIGMGIKGLGLVPVTKIDYVSGAAGAVAVR